MGTGGRREHKDTRLRSRRDEKDMKENNNHMNTGRRRVDAWTRRGRRRTQEQRMARIDDAEFT